LVYIQLAIDTRKPAFAARADGDPVAQIAVQASQRVKTKQVGVSYTGRWSYRFA
jgi:hypothetical protein